jgi:pimeloyl-ACP methyl ester carboxylesterase
MAPLGLKVLAGMSRTRYARSGQARIAYELRGRLAWWRPWLVLIQGVGFDGTGWAPVLRKLRRRFRLVLADNRGRGRSDPPGGSLTVAGMADGIVAVLDDAGLRLAHVLGVSLGGMVAQDLAFYHPDRVDGLVLVSTTPGWPFGYPMPPSSVRLLAATGRMTSDDALSLHTENALSAATLPRRPELADRIAGFQRARLPDDPRGWPAQVAAGAYYTGRLWWEDPRGFARAVTSFLRPARTDSRRRLRLERAMTATGC